MPAPHGAEPSRGERERADIHRYDKHSDGSDLSLQTPESSEADQESFIAAPGSVVGCCGSKRSDCVRQKNVNKYINKAAKDIRSVPLLSAPWNPLLVNEKIISFNNKNNNNNNNNNLITGSDPYQQGESL